jgi:hypothetical protein
MSKKTIIFTFMVWIKLNSISCVFYKYHIVYQHSISLSLSYTHTHTHINIADFYVYMRFCLLLVNQISKHCCLALWNPKPDSCHTMSWRSLSIERDNNNLAVVISMQSETHLKKHRRINHPLVSHRCNHSLVFQVVFTQVPNCQNNPLYDNCTLC